jgi:putative addiction module component (TIGR02574 family)
MPFGDLLQATLTLSFDDRTGLVHSLLESIEEDPEYEREVMEEVLRRYREFKEGRTELISGEEVFASLLAEVAADSETLTVPYNAREGIIMPLEDIRRKAMELSEFDRGELAYAILRDLEDEGFKVDWETLQVEGEESRSTQT